MSLVPSPTPDASATRRGVINLVAQTLAGVKTFTSAIVASAGVQLSALWNTNGAGSSDVGVKVGVSTADASVHASAKLLSVRAGIGGTEVESVYVVKGGVIYGPSGSSLLSLAAGGAVLANGNMNAQFTTAQFKISSQGTADMFGISNAGVVSMWGSDSSGTPGTATINKPCGKSAIASGATTVTINNTLCATGDDVQITWHGDLGAQSKIPYVSTGAGNFVVTVGTAPASAVAFCWQLQRRI